MPPGALPDGRCRRVGRPAPAASARLSAGELVVAFLGLGTMPGGTLLFRRRFALLARCGLFLLGPLCGFGLLATRGLAQLLLLAAQLTAGGDPAAGATAHSTEDHH